MSLRQSPVGTAAAAAAAARAEERKKAYKAAAADVEEARRRREDDLVVIRKLKREECLLKKRREAAPVAQIDPSSSASSDTKVVIDCQALPRLLQLLTGSHDKIIKKEACWNLSNIAAGTMAQVQAVIDANIIQPLVQLMQKAEFDIRTQAASAISNAIIEGSCVQVRFLL